MHICIFSVYMYVYTYACMYMHSSTYIYMYMYVYTYIYICICIITSVHFSYLDICICRSILLHVYTCRLEYLLYRLPTLYPVVQPPRLWHFIAGGLKSVGFDRKDSVLVRLAGVRKILWCL